MRKLSVPFILLFLVFGCAGPQIKDINDSIAVTAASIGGAARLVESERKIGNITDQEAREYKDKLQTLLDQVKLANSLSGEKPQSSLEIIRTVRQALTEIERQLQ